jgi:hypothetical protein
MMQLYLTALTRTIAMGQVRAIGLRMGGLTEKIALKDGTAGTSPHHIY